MDSLSQLVEYAKVNHIPIIRDASLSDLLKFARGADRILEVGTAIGYSACAMALNSNAIIDTIEQDSGRCEIACKVIDAFTLTGRINLYQGDADILLESIVKDKEYSLIFLDGNKSSYSHQVDILLPYLKDDGVIFVDNVNTMQYVLSEKPLWEVPRKHRAGVRQLREFLYKITKTPDLYVTIRSENDGTAIIKKRGNNAKH